MELQFVIQHSAIVNFTIAECHTRTKWQTIQRQYHACWMHICPPYQSHQLMFSTNASHHVDKNVCVPCPRWFKFNVVLNALYNMVWYSVLGEMLCHTYCTCLYNSLMTFSSIEAVINLRTVSCWNCFFHFPVSCFGDLRHVTWHDMTYGHNMPS